MQTNHVVKTMRNYGRSLCVAGAATAALLTAGCVSIEYVDSSKLQPPQPMTQAQAQRAEGGAPLVARDGTVLRVQPQTEAGPVQAYQNQPQGQRTIDGFVVTYHQVPQTPLTMATLVRNGQEAKVCYPGDTVETVNTRPNATISLNAEKSVCLHVAPNNQVVAYDPIPLPYDQAILSGANPWTSAENGRTRYVANTYSQQRDQIYSITPRLPTAITERGQFVANGFPLWVGRGSGITRADLKGFSFTPARPGTPPTGGVVNLQSAPNVR